MLQGNADDDPDGNHARFTDHPLCDMFFFSEYDTLVMIDVAGGTNYANKAKRLRDWLEDHPSINAKGFVLAPNAMDDAPLLYGDKVQIIRGNPASYQTLGCSGSTTHLV